MLGRDGKKRSGKIIVSASNFVGENAKRIICFDNFLIDGNLINGTIEKIIRTDTIGNKRAHIIENISITLAENKGVFSRISDMYRIYIFNKTTIAKDDKIISWGSSTFTNAKGILISKTIANITPLVYRLSCKQIVRGIQIVTRDDKTLTTDFGNGDCDNAALVCDGINTWTIKLK